MIKAMVKWFMPSGETLAGYAADGVAKSLNESEKSIREKVAQYSAYARTAAEISATLAKMAEDGTIDEVERKELQKMLTPLFDKVRALV